MYSLTFVFGACAVIVAAMAIYVPTVYIRKSNVMIHLLEQIAANTRKSSSRDRLGRSGSVFLSGPLVLLLAGSLESCLLFQQVCLRYPENPVRGIAQPFRQCIAGPICCW